ncbi:MAG: superinfection immunity protein [Burkholderiales bacterium]
MLSELSQRIAGYEMLVFVLAPLFLVAYFMPVLVAVVRRHRFAASIGAVNFVLGWTGLGWLGAMIWAVNRDIGEPQPVRSEAQRGESPVREPSWSEIALAFEDAEPAPTKNCSHCDQPVKADALICHHCGRETGSASAAETVASADLTDENLKDLFDALRDGDREPADEDQDSKLLDVINYARMLEERERAIRGELAKAAANESPDPESAGFEIVRRTGSGG